MISSILILIPSSNHSTLLYEILLFHTSKFSVRYRVRCSQLVEVVAEKVSHKPILFLVDSGAFVH